MKYFISILLLNLYVVNISYSTVEYGGLSTDGQNGYPTYIALNEGDILEVISCTSNEINYNSLAFFTKEADLDSGGNAYQIDGFISAVSTYKMNLHFDTFVGPLKIKVYRNQSVGNSNGGSFLLFYKITRAPNPQPAQAPTPAN